MTKKGLPDGWLPVSAIGKPISGTRFLAFKVPLKKMLCNNLQPHERFSTADLIEQVPNLRLVIDLTNTNRYYSKYDFINEGIKHVKIFCPGREIPAQRLMNQFFQVVDNFMQAEDTEDKYIGVHCTHGINRTGYFICTYMVKKLGFTPEEAISAFQEARGHDMVRQYLIDEINKIEEETSGETLQIDTQRHSKEFKQKDTERHSKQFKQIDTQRHSKEFKQIDTQRHSKEFKHSMKNKHNNHQHHQQHYNNYKPIRGFNRNNQNYNNYNPRNNFRGPPARNSYSPRGQYNPHWKKPHTNNRFQQRSQLNYYDEQPSYYKKNYRGKNKYYNSNADS